MSASSGADLTFATQLPRALHANVKSTTLENDPPPPTGRHHHYYFFNSAHVLCDSGMKASLPGTVATSL